MLNLFPEISVPGVQNVTVYHDDDDPNLFYMVSDTPVFKTGSDGKPMLRLIVVGEDFYLFKSAAADLSTTETEIGMLQMSVALEVSQAEQDTIRAYLASLRNYYRPCYQGGLVRFQRVAAVSDASQIKLGYPTWTTPAKVTFSLAGAGAGDSFIKVGSGSDAPSLMHECAATYVATLGEEGTELMRNAITTGWSGACVWYQVSFVARLPAINISISGDAKNVYSDIKNYCQVYGSTHQNGSTSTWSFPAVSSLDQLKTISASLTITYDDNDFTQATGGGGGGADIAGEISKFVLDTAMTYIQNIFFAPPFTPGVPAAELGNNPFGDSPWKDPNASTLPANQLYLKEFSQDMEGNFGFQATYNKNITVTKYPSSLLEGIISKSDYDACIITADLTKPFFQILDVTIWVTANFKDDPIAAIVVHCEYNQVDDNTGQTCQHSGDFTFQTGLEQFHFQVFMAKAKDGTPKDQYTYSTKLSYKYAQQPVTTNPVTTNERELLLGYDSLSCVRVAVLLGSVPTDTVARVQVHFEYPDPGLTLSSKTADIFLTPDKPSGSWFTFTGNNPSQTYNYQCTYFLVSGETLTTPVQSSAAATLAVSTPFVDTLTVFFVPQGSFPPVLQMVVSARYADPTNGYTQASFYVLRSLADSWKWQVRLTDRDQRAFQYKVDTTFYDGSSETGTWKDGTEGTIQVGDTVQKMLHVSVNPMLLDLTKVWKLVIVKLTYTDDANQVDEETAFQISAQNAGGPFDWRFPIKDQANKQYTYEVDGYAFDGTNKTLGPLQTTTSILVLQL